QADGGLRAIAREVAEDQIDVLTQSQPIVHVGDRRLFLWIELLRRLQHGRRAVTVGHRERAGDLDVVRFLAGGQPVEAYAIAGERGRLAAAQRRLGLHRPRLRAGDADGDDQDAQVHGEPAVAAI